MKSSTKRALQKQVKRYGAIVSLVALLVVAMKAPTVSAEVAVFDRIFDKTIGVLNSDAKNTFEVPALPRPEAVKTVRVAMTAYTSRPHETDGSPFITADGSVVRDGIVATNILPFGTKVRIPTLFGDKVFEVHDRMNARYTYRMDVWMPELSEARKFGLKRNVEIEVIEMGDGKKNWEQWKGRSADLHRIGKYGPADPPLPQPWLPIAKADEA